MGDKLKDAINALRSAGLDAEADAVEELRARHNRTMDAYHAGQRASYSDGYRDGCNSVAAIRNTPTSLPSSTSPRS